MPVGALGEQMFRTDIEYISARNHRRIHFILPLKPNDFSRTRKFTSVRHPVIRRIVDPQRVTIGIHIAQRKPRTARNGSMLRIETLVCKDLVTFALIGRLQSNNLPELKTLLAMRNSKKIVLDLREVRLVDREAITFLANFEKHDTTITNCPPYIREWIRRERASDK